ncbi:MAG: GNAT family N-acetyltransferase, partial [Desulfobacteraceae bacterium]|nr:GNAT family N-acetyltransferase [Desulfobacteraceae bacterium]
MTGTDYQDWEQKVVSPDEALRKIEPGMCIFLSTGTAEPRTMVRHLMDSDLTNLQDLELFQLLSFGDALSLQRLQSQKYRLKTFFSGWVAREAITEGRVDLIPSRFSRLTRLVASRRIPFDAAFVQVSPPNRMGYCSLGVSVDIAHLAIAQAGFVVGEINPDMPQTTGD